MDDLEIALGCRKEERDVITKLHQEAFAPIFTNTDSEKKDLTRLNGYLDAQTVVIARLRGEVVGYGAYGFYGELSKDSVDKVNLNSLLVQSRTPEKRQALESFLRKCKETLGAGDVVLNYYTEPSNPFTLDSFSVGDKDMVLAGVAVDPRFRRKDASGKGLGIGTKIAQKRLEIARDQGSSAVYTLCWGKSPITYLYEKLGFARIIELGPLYDDGSSCVFMGCIAKR